jgi:hypothetical protein
MWPPLSSDGHPLMPIGQLFFGIAAGGAFGAAVAFLGSLGYASQEEADRAKPKLEAEYRRSVGLSLSKALAEYATYLAKERENRASTIETTIGRIRALFTHDAQTDDLTPAMVRKLFEAFTKRPITKAGKLPSVDSKVGVPKQSRTFALWLHGKVWTKRSDLFEGLQVLGKRKRGKAQLSIDESETYRARALGLASRGDVGAIAALVPITRAGEVVGRRVRDLDSRGTKPDRVREDGGRQQGVEHPRAPAAIPGSVGAREAAGRALVHGQRTEGPATAGGAGRSGCVASATGVEDVQAGGGAEGRAARAPGYVLHERDRWWSVKRSCSSCDGPCRKRSDRAPLHRSRRARQRRYCSLDRP